MKGNLNCHTHKCKSFKGPLISIGSRVKYIKYYRCPYGILNMNINMINGWFVCIVFEYQDVNIKGNPPNSFEFEIYFLPIVLVITYQEYSKLSYRMSSCQNKIPIIGNLLIRVTGDMLANLMNVNFAFRFKQDKDNTVPVSLLSVVSLPS